MPAQERALIIEDDRDIADRATDGRTGLQKARENRYALVILDLMPPRMDGLTAAQRDGDVSLP